MFIDATVGANPELIEYAAWLHQNGKVGPNTYVIDLDRVSHNASEIVKTGRQYGLELYCMTKQFGRNPAVMKSIADGGLKKIVAVDVDEAKVLYEAGYQIAHVGHLVQIPYHDLKTVLAMEPEVVTVFGVEKASQVSEVAQQSGRIQEILLRVIDEGDFLHPGQFGGIRLADLAEQVERIRHLPGILVVGVTSHPCLLYDYNTGEGGPTHNLQTILKAAQILREVGVNVKQINTPGVSTCATIPMLAEYGSTHAEPGSALTGSTPLHAFKSQPEIPAMIYVSEVSHRDGNKIYCYGGGFYTRSHVKWALIGNSAKNLTSRKFKVVQPVPEAIDYYAEIRNDDTPGELDVSVGDTVILAFRTQIFVTRSQVAVVSGLASGSPVLSGVYDALGRKFHN